MITEKLRIAFPGICTLLSALKRAWKAYKAYNKGLKAVNALIASGSVAVEIQKVSENSPLSFREAYYIYSAITENTELYKLAPKHTTDFIMEAAGRGCSYYVIIEYLMAINRELDRWTRDKLRRHLK